MKNSSSLFSTHSDTWIVQIVIQYPHSPSSALFSAPHIDLGMSWELSGVHLNCYDRYSHYCYTHGGGGGGQDDTVAGVMTQSHTTPCNSLSPDMVPVNPWGLNDHRLPPSLSLSLYLSEEDIIESGSSYYQTDDLSFSPRRST